MRIHIISDDTDYSLYGITCVKSRLISTLTPFQRCDWLLFTELPKIEKGEMCMGVENKTLAVIQETEILGKKIVMYGSIEKPYFVASDVAKWLGERDGYTVARKVSEEEKDTQIVCTPGGDQRTTVLTEDGLYEACMLSRKEIAKSLMLEIKQYLKSIRFTGTITSIDNEEKCF